MKFQGQRLAQLNGPHQVRIQTFMLFSAKRRWQKMYNMHVNLIQHLFFSTTNTECPHSNILSWWCQIRLNWIIFKFAHHNIILNYHPITKNQIQLFNNKLIQSFIYFYLFTQYTSTSWCYLYGKVCYERTWGQELHLSVNQIF